MKMAPIASLFACALLIGWFAPELPTGNSAGQSQGDAPDPEAEREARKTREWLAGQTVLHHQRDGHFYADATVEGTQLRFLVDTGASIVALTGQDAEAIGLSWDESTVRPIGRGASGTVNGVPVQISRMEIDGKEARDVPAAIIPEGLDVSLLGQSFLTRIDSVEINGDEMSLGG